MPLFLIKRDFGIISEEDLLIKAAKSKEVCSEAPDIRWLRSYLALDNVNTITYCIYEAPDAEALVRQAKEADIPLDVIIPLEIEINPENI